MSSAIPPWAWIASGNAVLAMSARVSKTLAPFNSPRPGKIASATNSEGIKSGLMPRDFKASAVFGPMHAILTDLGIFVSSNEFNRSQTASTPLTLVSTNQLYVSRFLRAESKADVSSIGAISIVGKLIGIAPAFSS